MPTTPSKKRPGGWKYGRCAWPDPSNRSGQHPLLSKNARNVKPDLLWELSEEGAYATFCQFRWSENGGKARCPACGCRKAYVMRRRRFRCSDVACVREFSVTSGTVFHSRKLSFKKLIMAIWEELTAVKGLAALHLTRKLSVQYKTAWVLLAKIREAIGARRSKMKLWGTVQIDGKYVGGHIKPENKKSERIDRRKKENQNGKRVCIMSLRESNRHGPNRTFTRIVHDENT